MPLNGAPQHHALEAGLCDSDTRLALLYLAGGCLTAGTGHFGSRNFLIQPFGGYESAFFQLLRTDRFLFSKIGLDASLMSLGL